MKITLRVIIVMIFWMFIVTGIIFGINSLIEIPDEITAVSYTHLTLPTKRIV